MQKLFFHIPEGGIESPSILYEIKCYLEIGLSDESVIKVVTKAAAPDRDRKENFCTRLRKVVKGSVNVVHSKSNQGDCQADKLISLLEKFEK